ncbi:MAG: transketolase [Gammaproteobacteria bacterium]|nr:transketolase [Gammaproteobacteria bacterium]NIM71772.1 transketolase [Gammaproteobacteria bacterium]NIN37868.1 transketolase [Gammaproteobacteria bacterium]NIO23528.1 transketolase [Gammaproteobacteria bacterium]NIO64144.1 transketolase [Gammaproteobacteria bacterium]
MSTALRDAAAIARVSPADRAAILRELERKVLWLASWTIHNANHLRPSPDGLKVGGHQASCASLTTLMTALYFDVLRPEDRVAVKPHASPVFHAIQYLLGHQSRAHLERFRAMGGAQSYPSRTKDADDVDFSTGSVGLGVAMTTFSSLVQDYVQAREWGPASERGRMVALVGDAELDEGNVFEALLEGWKHDVRNLWWIVDYNRQSLDAVVSDRLFGRFDRLFSNMGWRVETLKYGKRLQAAFERPGGERLKDWIDDCPNSLYSALVFKGGAAWREHLSADIGASAGVKGLLDEYDDDALAALMTNLAGHDMESVLEAFHGADTDQPTCFIAYTIKGFGLPFAGHKDNHAGLMSVAQMDALRGAHRISEGQEWERFAGLELDPEVLDTFLARAPFAQSAPRRYQAPHIPVPESLSAPGGEKLSTQESFGRILATLARDGGELAERIVTASPDVTVSTNLGGWVNRRGIFSRKVQEDTFNVEQVASFQRWAASPKGQHIELGIAENNLFILLAALGLSHSLFGTRLLPIGTLYDPFIQRGLDALNYACYQDARFLLVATPSGVTLAPEGGAHQSISTPMIGMAQDGLASFEPAFADELAVIMRWAFDYMQREGESPTDDDWLADAAGGSVYLRLSTRSIAQPAREMQAGLAADIVGGGYWLAPPAPGARLAIVYTGAVASEAMAAHAQLLEDLPGAGLLAVTSADRLAKGWHAANAARRSRLGDARCHVEELLAPLAPDAHLITVVDGHPGTLGWLGSVRGQRLHSLGVEHFGQSGSIEDLYRYHGIDTDAILEACAAACLAP